MKQYDKIWVPARKEDPASDCWQIGTPMPQHGPVIVLIIEELIAVFAAGKRYGEDPNNPGLTNYLKSKGITI